MCGARADLLWRCKALFKVGTYGIQIRLASAEIYNSNNNNKQQKKRPKLLITVNRGRRAPRNSKDIGEFRFIANARSLPQTMGNKSFGPQYKGKLSVSIEKRHEIHT